MITHSLSIQCLNRQLVLPGDARSQYISDQIRLKNQKCVPGRTVEVKLLCNFSKIPKICNIIPNKRALLNHLS